MNKQPTKLKQCKHHGETIFGFDGKIWRCRKCRIIAVQKRRDNSKKKAIEYKGGKCSVCGYNKCTAALEFHHRDPSKKSFGVSAKGYTRSWEKIKKELDKCDLVCANCHREIEYSHKIQT